MQLTGESPTDAAQGQTVSNAERPRQYGHFEPVLNATPTMGKCPDLSTNPDPQRPPETFSTGRFFGTAGWYRLTI